MKKEKSNDKSMVVSVFDRLEQNCRKNDGECCQWSSLVDRGCREYQGNREHREDHRTGRVDPAAEAVPEG